MSNYLATFPDYDNAKAADSLLALGWSDESYINDVCPSFAKGRVAIFADYADHAKREIAGGPAFFAIITDSDGCYTETSQSFDDIDAARIFGDEVNSELTGDTTIEDAVKWVRFRLHLTTVDEARDLLDEEAASGRGDSEVVDYLANVLLKYWIGEIGLGFHIDTRGCDYSPALEHEADYDMDMGRVMLASDPYALALDHMTARPVTRQERLNRRGTLGGFAVSGNIAPIGRALRDGTIDTFQARAILDWMSPARWNIFVARWN